MLRGKKYWLIILGWFILSISIRGLNEWDPLSINLKKRWHKHKTVNHEHHGKKSFWRRHKWLIVAAGLLLLGGTPVVMAQTLADAPGEIGYPIKMAGEKVAEFMTFGRDAKEKMKFQHAAERVNEAVVVSGRLAGESSNAQIKDSQTIENLVNQFTQTVNHGASLYGSLIDKGVKLPQKDGQGVEYGMIQTYILLERLRLAAPPEAQSTILQAIAAQQTALATVQDTLGAAPITADDSKELSKLVSQGFLTRDELTKLLAGTTSNRQLLDNLRQLVKTGIVPASTLYGIDYDLVNRLTPKDAPRFTASVEFDEMRKVGIFTQAIVPTPEQKQKLQNYLSQYNFGQPLPRDASRAFITPLIYGLNLTPDLPTVLKQLDPKKLSPVRQVLYQAWQPLTTAQSSGDAKKLYSQVLELTNLSLSRNTDLLERVQLEVLKALRANVAYMALPPGWTDSQVAAVADDFAQSIKDLKAANAVQDKSKSAVASLASITAPLMTPLPEPQIDQIRLAILPQLATLQQQMVTASVSATNPAVVVPDLTNQVSGLQNQFDQLVAGLGAKPATAAADDLVALKAEVKQALGELGDAKAKIQDFVKANAALAGSLKDSVSGLAADSKATATKLAAQVTALGTSAASQADVATLKDTLQATQAVAGQNLASLQDLLTNAGQTQADARAKLELNLIGQSNQIAQLGAQLNLSDVARTALKDEVNSTIANLKTSQASDIKDLNAKISTDSALHAQLNDAAKKQISDLQSQQTSLLDALAAQASDKQLLKDQLEASIAAVKASQDQTHSDVQTLAASSGSLGTQLQTIKTSLDGANTQIKNNVAAETVTRAELQKSIDGLKTAQTLAAKQLDDGLLTLGIQLRQSINEVSAAQRQTDLTVASLGTSLTDAKDAISSIQSTQAGVQVQLQAQADASASLRQELEQSVATLGQAQAATQSQVNSLKTDVLGLKDSLSTITTAQAVANTKVDQLLAASVNWSALPASLQFNQAQFQQYENQLAADFAAKAAALQAQFQAYKTQLDGSIQTLRSDVNSQIQQLKADQATLKAQLQAAQQLLSQTTAATPAATTPTPTSTPTPTTTTAPGL